MKLPKSVPDSQRYLTWAFPALIAFGVTSLFSASPVGFIGVLVAIVMVLTGWLSFAIIPEESYNDLLFTCDLGLLSSYGLLIHFAGRLSSHLAAQDVSACVASAAVFFFYAIWDLVALLGTDTQASASAMQFRRFGFVCLAIAIMFAAISVSFSQLVPLSSSAAEVVAGALRVLWLATWLVILGWWHFGRIKAAIVDGHSQ